jgi:hypothetical protein
MIFGGVIRLKGFKYMKKQLCTFPVMWAIIPLFNPLEK